MKNGREERENLLLENENEITWKTKCVWQQEFQSLCVNQTENNDDCSEGHWILCNAVFLHSHVFWPARFYWQWTGIRFRINFSVSDEFFFGFDELKNSWNIFTTKMLFMISMKFQIE